MISAWPSVVFATEEMDTETQRRMSEFIEKREKLQENRLENFPTIVAPEYQGYNSRIDYDFSQNPFVTESYTGNFQGEYVIPLAPFSDFMAQKGGYNLVYNPNQIRFVKAKFPKGVLHLSVRGQETSQFSAQDFANILSIKPTHLTFTYIKIDTPETIDFSCVSTHENWSHLKTIQLLAAAKLRPILENADIAQKITALGITCNSGEKIRNMVPENFAETNQALQKLEFFIIQQDEEDLRLFEKVFSKKALQSLSLCIIRFNVGQFHRLIENGSTLTEFCLQIPYPPPTSDEDIKRFTNTCSTIQNLTSLVWTVNTMEKGVTGYSNVLYELLKRNQALEYIELTCGQVHGVVSSLNIAQALIFHKNVQSFALETADLFTVKEIKAFEFFLKTNPLKKLAFSFNDITEEATSLFLESIHSTVLKELRLRGLMLTEKNLPLLKTILDKNENLQKVALSVCPLTNQGILSLVDVLQNKPFNINLTFNGCRGLTPEFIPPLIESLRKNEAWKNRTFIDILLLGGDWEKAIKPYRITHNAYRETFVVTIRNTDKKSEALAWVECNLAKSPALVESPPVASSWWPAWLGGK